MVFFSKKWFSRHSRPLHVFLPIKSFLKICGSSRPITVPHCPPTNCAQLIVAFFCRFRHHASHVQEQAALETPLAVARRPDTDARSQVRIFPLRCFASSLGSPAFSIRCPALVCHTWLAPAFCETWGRGRSWTFLRLSECAVRLPTLAVCGSSTPLACGCRAS